MPDKFPDKSQRKTCYDAKDSYFSCLDENNLWLQGIQPSDYNQVLNIDPLNLNPLPDVKSNAHLYTCRHFKLLMENSCLASWSSHFSMLRMKALQTEYLRKKLECDQESRGDDFWTKVKK